MNDSRTAWCSTTTSHRAFAVLLGVALVACDGGAPNNAAAPRSAPRSAPTAPGSTASAVQPTTATASRPAPRKARPAGELRIGELRYYLRHTGGAKADETLPMIVAIHGLGDRPDRFLNLFDGFTARARFVAPRGLDPHVKGFSWFPIRVRATDPKRVSKGVKRTADTLAEALDELSKRHPTQGRPVVTGFSQGGMLSFTIAVHHPTKVRAAVPLAGWLPEPLWPQTTARGAPPIVALHGELDDVLPLAATQASVKALRAKGHQVELLTFPKLGHGVNKASKAAYFEQLAKALPRSEP